MAELTITFIIPDTMSYAVARDIFENGNSGYHIQSMVIDERTEATVVPSTPREEEVAKGKQTNNL